MNKVMLVGRLTKAPELRYTSQGSPVAGFTLAIDRRGKKDQKKQADYISVIVWGSMGENSSKYLHKGSQAAIFGRLQTRSYNANDGTKRYVVEVVAEEVQFLDSKKESDKSSSEGFGTPLDDFTPIEDDDLPF
ncbi:single-stranded DNA-binding protein [Alkalibaculum sp. M08DMB]|uniref:Single-stranded DNA-binding protein n=1 Tax=Alkalibaculum sporogenes TaxID=2655001 RepID=A0A6A7KA50_9FIRM|nr:single-stranded DNA-binding protein [Alkalibaculum sporogenes]MPW26419.1 single-stranded DNA-binding protein [Alkalibaculum sporogenes]